MTPGAWEHTFEDVPGYEGCSCCSTCGGFEGSTPTDCPGHQLSQQVLDRVYAGVLDFVAGRWVQRERKGLVIRMPYSHTHQRPMWAREIPRPHEPIPLDAVERWENPPPGASP